MAILEVDHIQKSFGGTNVLRDISFSLEKGQVLSIIGSSGSGKTTLLRCLNFLETAESGVIRVNGKVLFDGEKQKHCPTVRSGRTGCISVWCSSPSTCSPSTPCWKT